MMSCLSTASKARVVAVCQLRDTFKRICKLAAYLMHLTSVYLTGDEDPKSDCDRRSGIKADCEPR
ncbi:hypothetical protein IG631_22098 [Alternaria alternata]|nr:hypothetical protein IG631_22098 [Alternaria alternata]